MIRVHWTVKFVLVTAVLLPLVVLCTRPFVDSWDSALAYGLAWHVALVGVLLWAAHRSRRADRRQREEREGRITIAGPTLTFQEPRREASSVHAAGMRELRYVYNGLWSTNNWALVHEAGQERTVMEIDDTHSDHLRDPLRAWCVRNLPAFDLATFDRLAGSTEFDGEPVVVWSRGDG